MGEFKCSNCGHDKPHIKTVGEKEVDKIWDIKNPAINARIYFQACEKCHILHAFWEDFEGAEGISDRDKQIAKEVLNKNEDDQEQGGKNE